MNRLIVVSLLIVILMMGCFLKYDYELEVPETRTYPASGISQISASTENGGITVSATQDTIITVDVTRRCKGKDKADAEMAIENVVVTDNVAGGQLTLEAEMPDGGSRNYGAEFEISAPASIYLVLSTSNGAVSLTDMSGGADVSTSNGAITVENTHGHMELSTSNGKVRAQAHHGGIEAQSSNGEIDCDIAFLGATESAILHTSNGKVTLSLPSDVSATFDASTSNGEVTVTGFSSVSYTKEEKKHKIGQIGAGDASITITTSNGDITIRAR